MRKLFSLFLALVATASLWAEDFSVDGIYYNYLEDNNVVVTYRGNYSSSYDEYSGEIVIPSTVRYNGITYSVTSIGTSAFSYCSSLTSIDIPNSVTSIGANAFSYCSSLASIIIPESVTSIGEWAFSDCTSLTTIDIPNSVTSIGTSAFSYCSSLTSPVYNAHCFAYMPTSYSGAYTIPEGIEQIAGGAFDGCSSLTSVTLPNSVMEIGNGAFRDCSGLLTPVYNAHCFAYMPTSYSGAYTIPEGIEQIAGGAFRDCSSLTSVTIGNSITSIGEYAFYLCSSLTSVTIGNSVTSIGEWAFLGCSSLTSIDIPNSVTSIGDDAFAGCSSLTSVTIGNSVTSIGESAFYLCSSLTSITIPNSVTSIGESAFEGCSSLTSITIPNSVTSIGDQAFYRCSSLTSVTIPNSVTTVGGGMFYGCSKLKSVVLSNNITSLPSHYENSYKTVYGFFGKCSSLTSVTIGNSVTSIGEWAFSDCTSLTSIDIPNSVTSIGTSAFEYCFSLTSITIPNSVTSIGGSAFYNCSYLTSITCEAETPPTLGSDAFYAVSKSIPVYVPCGCVEAYKAASNWKDFTNIQEPLAEYSIEVDVNGSIMGCAKVDKNTACGNQISATANYGYHFVRWSDGYTDNPRTLTLTQDTVLTAEFAINQYTITTVSSDTQRGTTKGDTTVNYLEYITISATANYGYHFSHWNDYNYDNPRQVQVTKDMTYTATFDKNTYAISLSCNEEQGSVEGVTSAKYLDTVTISATPNIGYHFVQWSDGVTDNPRTLELTQDTILIAEFAQSFSGQCGNDLYWAYNQSDQSISITGTGYMYDYYTPETQPWALFMGNIKKVTTDNTAKSFGAFAFDGAIRLAEVHIGTSIETIDKYAFGQCDRLRNIYCYPTYPPIISDDSFVRYDANLYIPCDYIEDYMFDYYWKKFENVQCAGAEKEEMGSNGVEVAPSSTSVTITWPTEDNADTYTIVIKKDGEVFCTLTFNADGQLLNIAFAPGRDGNHPAQYAEQAGNGYRFTVTSLESGTKYGYNIDVKDASNKTIKSHSGEFTTQSTTAVDNITTNNANIQKIIRDGQFIILRDGIEYNAIGQEL